MGTLRPVRGELIVSHEPTPTFDTLEGLLPKFFMLCGTVRDERTKESYRRAVRWLGEMLGHQATLDDLTDENLAALLGWLATTRNQLPTTANGTHKCICRLWRWCRDKGMIYTGPTVPKLRVAKRIPKAWTADELQKLVTSAASFPGSIGGIPARNWWLTLFGLEWDTAMRVAELLAVRWEWIDWGRKWLTVPAEVRKGQRSDASYGLMPDTLEQLQTIRKEAGLILGWDCHESRYYQLWDKLLRMAGLPPGRRSKTQCLRRSFASHLAANGGNAQLALGHGSFETTQKHYIDPTLTQKPAGLDMPFRILSFVKSAANGDGSQGGER